MMKLPLTVSIPAEQGLKRQLNHLFDVVNRDLTVGIPAEQGLKRYEGNTPIHLRPHSQ